jgi:hypothetical protein
MHWLPLQVSHGHILTKNKGKTSHKTQYKDFALKGIQRLGIDKWYEAKHKKWEDGIRDQSEEGTATWEEVISHGDTSFWDYWNVNKERRSINRHRATEALQARKLAAEGILAPTTVNPAIDPARGNLHPTENHDIGDSNRECEEKWHSQSKPSSMMRSLR